MPCNIGMQVPKSKEVSIQQGEGQWHATTITCENTIHTYMYMYILYYMVLCMLLTLSVQVLQYMYMVCECVRLSNAPFTDRVSLKA